MIVVIGLGPGTKKLLTQAAAEAAGSCTLLLGSKRQLTLLEEVNAEKQVISLASDELINILKAHADKRIGVLATGDPGLFGILAFLRKRFKPSELEVIPGISSVQLFFAKLAMPWQDIKIASLHGRSPDILPGLIGKFSKICLFTDSSLPPEKIADELELLSWQGRLILGERLGMKDERISNFKVRELMQEKTRQPALLYLESK